jgi:hypothetical protein
VRVAGLDEFLSDPIYAGAVWYTDGSLLEGSTGGAVMRVEDGAVCERILIPLGDGQVAEGEIEGLLQATKRALDGNAG